MDAVKSFNAELSGLYEVKPPISKAKMTSITRGAIKAIKFYKHVVQSVEKFILKCKPEYKIPGLYVIDSIVRQSRHQFGADRDVFAPRFAKNMQQTFVNLFKCPGEDKSKVIRVLNLWQKNQVFPPEVIQPLFDLADPNHPIYRETLIQSNGLATQNTIKGSPALQKSPIKGPSQTVHPTDAALTHLSGVANNPNALHTDSNTLAQLQQLHKLLQRQGGENSIKNEQQVRFDRKLLDFDYGDDEDEDHVNPSPKPPLPNNPNPAIETVGSLLSNPEVIRQLQTLQQSMSQTQHQELDLEKLRKLQEMKQQEEEFDKHLAQTIPNLPFAAECELKPPQTNNSPAALLQAYYLPSIQDMSIPPPGYKQQYDIPSQQEEATMDSEIQYMGANDSGDVEVINLDHTDSRSQSPRDDRYSNRRRRTRSRDRSRDRSRNRDRDRDRRSRRSRTRSRSRDRRRRTRSRERDRERDKEREKEREKVKERRKRGLPPIKKENMSVCSTTLWVGHLSKLVHQEELSDTFGEFGDIVSIDLIPPRGCAFIVMHRRQDAARCLQKLKNHKMQGKAITVAWAPGKGVKGKDLKDYWEVDLGVSYIPWSKIKQDIDLEMLEDGGMVDEDTMPMWLKAKVIQQPPKLMPPPQPPLIPTVGEVTEAAVAAAASAAGTNIDTSQPPPMPGGSLLQPTGLPLSLVNPFQLNNRLLGPVGMNLPPGMMPNVPIGVPPPNMPPGAVMANQLLGLNSPFTQPPSLLSQLQLSASDKVATTVSESMSSGTDSVLGMTPFGMMPQPPITIPPPHDDNMDVEMEDAEKTDKQPSLSEQLLASIVVQRSNQGSYGNNSDRDDRRDRRDDKMTRGRERDRDKDRDRRGDRGRRNSRDKDRDSRDRRDDRRDRPNRWNDRDRKDRDNRNERDDRRNEKSLNDRLREMAHQSSFPNRDRSRGNSIEDASNNGPPSLLDRPLLFPPQFNNSEVPRNLLEADEDIYRQVPPEEFNEIRGPDEWIEESTYMNDGPPIFNRDDGPPRPFFDRDEDGPPLREDGWVEEERFMRRDCRDDYIEEPMGMRDNFEPPIRGPPGFGPGPGMGPIALEAGIGPGPRGPRPDFWGPPRGMRGPGPDFHPRGRPPGPHMFRPRGPHMRGPRPPGPPWMDGGMRTNFQPRFDGPPDFFRGSAGPNGPPGRPQAIFDEPPHHLRHRRYDDRRHYRPERPDFNNEENVEFPRDKRTRWNSSPKVEDSYEKQETNKVNLKEERDNNSDFKSGELKEEVEEKPEVLGGSATPLHDEPQEANVIEITDSPKKEYGAVKEETLETLTDEQQ